MARTHIPIMEGTLAPGASDIFAVTVGRKVLVSSMLLSATVPTAVPCEVELFITRSLGLEELVMRGEITNDANTNPFNAVEPWIVLMSADALRLHNNTAALGPNLQYVLSGIEYNPP